MNLPAGIDRKRLDQLPAVARQEDLGLHGDLTSRLLPEGVLNAEGRWELTPRRPGRFCSRALLPTLLESLAPEVTCEWIDPNPDTADLEPGRPVARLIGLTGQMLAA